MKFTNTTDWDISVNGQTKRKAGEQRDIKDSYHQEFLMRHPHIKPSYIFQGLDKKEGVKLTQENEEKPDEKTDKESHKKKREKNNK